MFFTAGGYHGGMPCYFVFALVFTQTRKRILCEHFPQTAEVLNEREMEVALLAAEGFSNREISARLYLSEDGVKSRLRSIFEKISVTSRKQLGDILKL